MNSSVKENDLIYHDIVPKIDVLAPIEKLGAAKLVDPDSDQLETLFAEMAAATTDSNPSHTANIMDDQPSNIPITSLVELVRESMFKLNQLKKERNELLSNLKKQTREYDISHILVLNQKSNVENQVFASELEIFRPLQNKVNAAVHHQQAILQELTSLQSYLHYQYPQPPHDPYSAYSQRPPPPPPHG